MSGNRAACGLIVAAVWTLGGAGCAVVPSAPSAPSASARPPMKLPASAEPAEEIKPLAFLAGRWVGVAPRASLVNEEHWMAPRGNAMIGTFRQVRRDGKTAFVEVSQIEATETGILLRVRHLHGRLEVPEKRAAVSVFTLKSLSPDRAEFAGLEAADGVLAMIYRLSDDGLELTQELVFDPAKSNETSFVSVYRREGH